MPFKFANIRRFGHFLRLVGEKNGSIFPAHASWQAKHLKSHVLLSLGITFATKLSTSGEVMGRMKERIGENEAQRSATLSAWTCFSRPRRGNRLVASN
jgi:hypothetical protein